MFTMSRRAMIASGAVAVLVAGVAIAIPQLTKDEGSTEPQASASDPTNGASANELTPIKSALDFPVGVAIDSRETQGAAAELLLHHFDQITPENHMKPEAWYDADHHFAPSPEIDTLMSFAQENNVRVYGHVLAWHSQTPAWFFQDADGNPLTDSAADQEVLRQRLKDHIEGIAKYLSDGYGKFGSDTNPLVAFDVVNEVVADSDADADGLRRSEWYRILGPRFIDLAFEYADEAFNGTYADSSADRPIALFINDYSTEQSGKRGRYKALIADLLTRGVPVDGIGQQFHVTLTTPIESLDEALTDMEVFGLPQAVTEFDVPTGVPVNDAKLIKQGHYIQGAVRIFKAHADGLFSVTIWGLHDGRSWRDEEGAPLIFAEDLSPKQAYYGLVDGAEPGLLDEIEDPDSVVALTEVDVPEAAEAPTVDAVRDAVWDTGVELTTEQPVLGDTGSVADSRVLWKDDVLYVWMHVADDAIDVTGSDPWIQDSIEIYVDAGNAKNGSYRDEDMQLRISATNVLSFGTGDEAAQAARVTSATATVDDGYVVEVAIAMLGLGGAGTTHGFDLQVNGASNGARDSVRNWNDTTGTGYQTTGVWGVVHLVGN